ncbi:hypothetical protein [Glaciihabitans sp. dw_435]|uniref:hypothetical protein n=1 Tax=Glaciihabitans sp. dw_435 TaxID=2720081 RepID=UPI001BD2DA1C|nr:hypothetical protein [Glaciihabitans sp. dw_435]
MRRALISWLIALALLIGAFVVTIVMLNGTVYSAGGFVNSYLDALSRQDATTAREMPGVVASPDAAADLLTDDALGALSKIRQVRDVAGSDGTHTVTYEYSLNGQVSETDFQVKQTGAIFGLFHTWSFATSPLATVSVTVLHDQRFRANDVALTSTAAKGASASYLVFAPGLYTFDHKSTFLEADPVPAAVTEPGSVTAVQVNVQANPLFVTQVSTELKDYLATCAKQEVLLPTGCPFGKSFDNRVDSTPKWTIAEYPAVQIIPGSKVGSWLMPETDAAAHLKVNVQSLYDGSISKYDKDVSFSVSYGITITDKDELTINSLGD